MGRNAAREAKYQWVVEVYADSLSFATLQTAQPISSFAEAKLAGTILTVPKAIPESVLLANGVTKLETSGPDEESQLKKLIVERGVAWFGSTTIIKYLINKRGTASKIKIGVPVVSVSYWISASKDVPADIVKKLQDAYKRIKANGLYDKIFSSLK